MKAFFYKKMEYKKGRNRYLALKSYICCRCKSRINFMEGNFKKLCLFTYRLSDKIFNFNLSKKKYFWFPFFRAILIMSLLIESLIPIFRIILLQLTIQISSHGQEKQTQIPKRLQLHPEWFSLSNADLTGRKNALLNKKTHTIRFRVS